MNGHVYSKEELDFLAKLWEISPELHDTVARMFREGTTLTKVKEILRYIMVIVKD